LKYGETGDHELCSFSVYIFLVAGMRMSGVLTELYIVYDSLFEIARCLTEIYSSLKFCQPVIFGDFLSDTDEFLSHLIEFLSNTQGYLDSLLFCQCP